MCVCLSVPPPSASNGPLFRFHTTYLPYSGHISEADLHPLIHHLRGVCSSVIPLDVVRLRDAPLCCILLLPLASRFRRMHDFAARTISRLVRTLSRCTAPRHLGIYVPLNLY